MNKITKKLFLYFAALLLFFAIIAFAGFSLTFSYYTYQSHEHELKERVQTIASRLEEFMETKGPKQGRGAYLRFLDDIAMADAYIIGPDGGPFSYGQHAAAANIPTEAARKFAARVFSSGSYKHSHEKNSYGKNIFYAGMPAMADGQPAAAVVIIDATDTESSGFLPAISVLAGCLPMALIFSGILSLFLSRRFVMPIQQIARTVTELASGNYLAETSVHDKTELGELAGEIDFLAQKLEAARLESSRLEQMQKDYISNISHELRTPVTVIRSSLEAICDGVVKGEKAAEYQRQVLAESISLQRLINDMLELSRLQNKDFPIENENMDLLMALEDAVRAVRVLAAEKSISILYEKPEDEWLVFGDYGRLRQMFIAVLDNAIKYSDDGKQILISARIDPDAAIVSILDHGCGIPPEDMPDIFARFYRSRPGRTKGSGLGLAIMKSIGERHGISISLQSAVQVGTEVIFSLPAALLKNTRK